MNGLLRYLIGLAVFVALLMFGDLVLHIRPSFAEVLLICIALGISDGIRDGLE